MAEETGGDENSTDSIHRYLELFPRKHYAAKVNGVVCLAEWRVEVCLEPPNI